MTAIPRRLKRPRTLFLTARHRLAGLPGDRRRVAAPPAPAVTPGLAQPSDAVIEADGASAELDVAVDLQAGYG